MENERLFAQALADYAPALFKDTDAAARHLAKFDAKKGDVGESQADVRLKVENKRIIPTKR